MIIGVHGNLGNGKTALLTRLATHFSSLCEECGGIINENNIINVMWEDGFEPFKCTCTSPMPSQIHANYKINIDNLHYVKTLDDIEKVFHGWAFYDELWTWIDSRVSGHSDVNMVVTGCLHKSRKRGYGICYEAKLDHMIDRRIRELTDYVLEPNLYIEQDGELVHIEQHLLYPINLKPYLDKIWIVVDMLSGTDLIPLHHAFFQFPLTDVVDMYDTREEVEMIGKHPGLPEGIKKEHELGQYLKLMNPNSEILHSTMSRGWDLVYKNNDKIMAFDCVSPRKDDPRYKKPRLDIRGKRIKELLKSAYKSKMTPYWAFQIDGKWYSMPMREEHQFKSILNTKEAKLIKDIS